VSELWLVVHEIVAEVDDVVPLGAAVMVTEALASCASQRPVCEALADSGSVAIALTAQTARKRTVRLGEVLLEWRLMRTVIGRTGR
jgi:hypothetical protein